MRLFLIVILLFLWQTVLAQCPVADFDLPLAGCREQNLYLENNSMGSQTHEWDVCSGDLQFTPTAHVVVSGSTFFRARVFRMVQGENGLWHGFAIDQPNNLLVRFDFGSSPDNTPTVVSLGNPGSQFQNPLDVHFISESNNWFALVANTAGNNLLRLNFGSDLTSTPSVTDLGSIGGLLQSPGGVNTIRENENLYAFVSNGSTSQIISLSFGNSILSTPTSSIIPVPGSSGLRSMDFIRECNRWFGVITSYNSGSLFYLDFQNGVGLPPVIDQLVIPSASYSFPASIKLVNEGGEFFAFIQSAFPAHVYRIAFGESISDLTGSFSNLGNFGISNDNGAFELVGFNSSWRGFSIDLSGAIPSAGRLYRFNFPEICSTPIRTFNGLKPPPFIYSTAGAYRITLKSVDGSGNLGYKSKVISISSDVSPDIDFESENICSNYPVNFTSINSSSNISSFQWNFGDFNTSIQQNPSYTYNSAGRFVVELNVTGLNGCTNVVQRELSIHNEPLADFSLPEVSPICSNQTYQFLNTTQYDTGLDPSWEWLVNGVPVSTNFNLESSFDNPISQTIKLISAIPGCANEVVKVISLVKEGPVADFAFTGQCQDTPISFVNQSIGAINSYGWNFGDGQNSSLINPVNLFAVPGTYDVTLTAFGATGCNNTRTKSITIYSKPQTNFSLALPPFSCSGSESLFSDETPNPDDSNLASWFWTFLDGAFSDQRNPAFVFNEAGTYDVSLTVTTNQNCSNTIVKQVQIAPSAKPDFEYSPACIGLKVDFNDKTDLNGNAEVKQYRWEVNGTSYLNKNIEHIFSTPGEYKVELSVTTDNECLSTGEKTISVKGVPQLNFGFSKNCAGEETQFTQEVSAFATDPIAAYTWIMAGQEFNAENVNYLYNQPGSYPVQLKVRTTEGCEFSFQKSVNIVPAPISSFTTSAEIGARPFNVNFKNTSQHASSFLWTVFDEPVRTFETSDVQYTFSDTGEFEVRLRASNVQGCESLSSKFITVVDPVIDLELRNVLLQTSGGVTNAIATIKNNSNAFVNNFSVRLDLGGTITLQKIFTDVVAPGALFNAVFDVGFSLNNNDLRFICADVIVDADVNPGNNTYCLNLDRKIIVFNPYPNPARTNFAVDIITENTTTAKWTITSLNGALITERSTNLDKGLNKVEFNLEGTPPGIYLLKIQHLLTGETKVFRVVITP